MFYFVKYVFFNPEKTCMIMKRILVAIAAAAIFCIPAKAQRTDFQNTPRIEISGHAEEKVQPDTFEITVAFGETKEFFGKQNIERLEQQIVDVLKKNGIDIKKDVKVQSTTNSTDNGKTVLIKKRISFNVGSYGEFYSIAKALDFKGIERVYISAAKYSKEDQVKARLRGQALADAKTSAQQILSGTGDSVGRILYISAGRAYVQARMVGSGVMLYSAKAPANDMAERYESFEQSDDITITFDLQASFEIVSSAGGGK